MITNMLRSKVVENLSPVLVIVKKKIGVVDAIW